MNSISFKNFRRFTEFPKLEYGPITFLVGKNNSGKSTLVKSLLLVDQYLKSNSTSSLEFAGQMIDSTNIVTFGRARNINTSDDVIIFKHIIESYKVSLRVTGNENDTKARVVSLLIEDIKNGFYFEFKPQSATVYLGRRNNYLKESKQFDHKFSNWVKEISDIRNEITYRKDLKKTSSEFLKLVDKLNFYLDRQKFYENTNLNISYTTKISKNYLKDLNEKISRNLYEAETDYNINLSIGQVIQPIIEDLTHIYKLSKSEDLTPEEKKEYEDFQGFYDDKMLIEKSFLTFRDLVFNHSYVYLGAYSIKQKSLFLIRDVTNPMAQAVHDFTQLKITEERSNPAYKFLRKWMKEFEIGDDLMIKMEAGEAYSVYVQDEKANCAISLSDKGMGSIQAMLLILRLSIVIQNSHLKKDNRYTLCVEEPELNLHPALQSKLAILFLEVNQLYGIKFIIETHSEYLIRKTQNLVVDFDLAKNKSANPFYIFYFPDSQDECPYQLKYLPNGRFNRNFGEGFFDVATKSTMSLLKPKMKTE